jgi:hypothetical protein
VVQFGFAVAGSAVDCHQLLAVVPESLGLVEAS